MRDVAVGVITSTPAETLAAQHFAARLSMQAVALRAAARHAGRRRWKPILWPERHRVSLDSAHTSARCAAQWSSSAAKASLADTTALDDLELHRHLRDCLEPLRTLARQHRLLEVSEEALQHAGLTRPVLESIVQSRGPGPAALAEVRLAALRALGAEHRAEVLRNISSQAVAVDDGSGSASGGHVSTSGLRESGDTPLYCQQQHARGNGSHNNDDDDARRNSNTNGGVERYGHYGSGSPFSSSDVQRLPAVATPLRPSLAEALMREGLPAYVAEPGQHRVVCPRCEGGSTGEASLAVKSDGKSAVWVCHRATCAWTGTTSRSNNNDGKPDDYSSNNSNSSAIDDALGRPLSARRRKSQAPLVRPSPNFQPLTPEMYEFFESRAIPREIVEANGIACETAVVPGAGGAAEVVLAFPYTRNGELLNIKYRTLDKRFWQVRGAEKVLFGLDQLDLRACPDVVIVEGEMDKLAMEAAGVRNVLSVPDGAPARVKEDLPPAEEDTKFSYLWRCKPQLDAAARVLVATDNDGPGEALAEELARRLGRERCWRVRWPIGKNDYELAAAAAGIPFDCADDTGDEVRNSESDDGNDDTTTANNNNQAATPAAELEAKEWYRKDANEVLMKDGPQMLHALVEAAQPLPIRGLFRFHEYYDDILRHYYLDPSMSQAVSTGWPCLDPYYKVVPGELTIVTGVPNSGKSEWIDALLCNLAYTQGWTFALCSMEKKTMDHARQLVEKYTGRPFFDLPYANRATRMSVDQLNAGLDWVDDRFHLIRYEDDTLPSVDWVLEVARAAVYRYGIRGLVIDPYNELDHQRPGNMSETEYVSHMLTKIKRFAQVAGVHVWFVAHPRQLQQWRGEAPGLYDISGSAHFINKADNGIVVHRNRDPAAENPHEVQILVRKVRNKIAGMLGETVLEYDRVNGRYIDPTVVGRPVPTSARVRHLMTA